VREEGYEEQDDEVESSLEQGGGVAPESSLEQGGGVAPESSLGRDGGVAPESSLELEDEDGIKVEISEITLYGELTLEFSEPIVVPNFADNSALNQTINKDVVDVRVTPGLFNNASSLTFEWYVSSFEATRLVI